MNFEHKRAVIFLDRDGVINHEISFIHKPEQFQLFDNTAKAVKKINHSEYLAIVITNQSVIARNLCSFEELDVIHKKMETELGKERAKLDAVYFCPHHPDKGFPEERTEYKIDCECRKPKPGMLLQAAKDFNIDLSASFMIGDSERDILAGFNAGCTTIGVRAGYGVKKTKKNPDYMFRDLEEAVDFIIDDPFASHLDDIKLKIESSEKRPFVIAIGGNARSGKSLLASYLSKKISKKVLRIELDNWLLPENKRDKSMNVFDRFQLNKIEKDIETLIHGKNIEVDIYKTQDTDSEERLNYLISDAEIIIIDGVVALSSEKLQKYADVKIFMKSDENIRKERLDEFYKWRGKDQQTIDAIIAGREEDEYQLIEKDIKFADIVINN